MFKPNILDAASENLPSDSYIFLSILLLSCNHFSFFNTNLSKRLLGFFGPLSEMKE